VTEGSSPPLSNDEQSVVGFVLASARPVTATVISMNVGIKSETVAAILARARALRLIGSIRQPGAQALQWVAAGTAPLADVVADDAAATSRRRASKEFVPAPLVPATVYRLGALTLVPHYTERGVWVAPGGARYTVSELVRMGAVASTAPLWSRPDDALGCAMAAAASAAAAAASAGESSLRAPQGRDLSAGSSA